MEKTVVSPPEKSAEKRPMSEWDIKLPLGGEGLVKIQDVIDGVRKMIRAQMSVSELGKLLGPCTKDQIAIVSIATRVAESKLELIQRVMAKGPF